MKSANTTTHADVLIVGGGVMGMSAALRLAERGVSCRVLERSVPGAEASSAAAGMLAPCVEAHDDFALRIGLESRGLHASLAQQLADDHRIDIGHRVCGALVLEDPDRPGELDERHDRLHAHHVAHDIIDPRALEPRLSDRFTRALSLDEEAQLEPKLLLKALAIAAEAAGARFTSGAIVRELLFEGDRVIGARVDNETLYAGHVLVAAGSWTTLVPGLSLQSDTIHPVRGQIVAARSRGKLFSRLLFGAGGYVLTRPDGRLLIGSTEERVGFARGVTLSGLRAITEIASGISPALNDAVVSDHWSSFRPGTPDGLPLVGELSPGLCLASGHFRNGILLAPLTAQWVANCITNNEAPPARVSPTRFSE